jgi:hypothetical protein
VVEAPVSYDTHFRLRARARVDVGATGGRASTIRQPRMAGESIPCQPATYRHSAAWRCSHPRFLAILLCCHRALDHVRMHCTADDRLRPNLSQGKRTGIKCRILVPHRTRSGSRDRQAVAGANERSLRVTAPADRYRPNASVTRHVSLHSDKVTGELLVLTESRSHREESATCQGRFVFDGSENLAQ